MAKPKIVITDYYYETLTHEKEEVAKIDALLEDYHLKTEDEVIAVTKDADAVICQFAPITRRVIENLEQCKVIVRYAIGVDNIDVQAAAEHGIYVCNVPDYSIDEVSNHTIALLMACVRKLKIADQAVRDGRWSYTDLIPLYRMAGKTLGLVGLGRIPSMVAKKMKGFDLHIIAYDPYQDKDYAASIGVTLVTLDELLETSDYICLHCPLNESTRHLFDSHAFAKMKKSAVLINTARGAVVCEDALIEALQNGQIAMAGLDVCEKEPIDPESELLKMPNIIVTPHIGWYSIEAVESLQQKVAQEAVRVLSGEKPLHPVNKPVAKS